MCRAIIFCACLTMVACSGASGNTSGASSSGSSSSSSGATTSGQRSSSSSGGTSSSSGASGNSVSGYAAFQVKSVRSGAGIQNGSSGSCNYRYLEMDVLAACSGTNYDGLYMREEVPCASHLQTGTFAPSYSGPLPDGGAGMDVELNVSRVGTYASGGKVTVDTIVDAAQGRARGHFALQFQLDDGGMGNLTGTFDTSKDVCITP